VCAGSAESGAKLALCARNQEKLEQLAARSTSKGGRCGRVQVDVASEDEIKAVVKAVIARFGKIDILVTTMRASPRDQLVMPHEAGGLDECHRRPTWTAPYLLTQAVIGSMLKQRWGRIINITSIFGQILARGGAGQAILVVEARG